MNNFNFKEGEILLINKPLYWTSFDVVNKIRKLIYEYTGDKTIKVGHAGTLDPLANGLIIICTGKFTKTIDQIQNMPKEYIATIELGKTTPSFDLETDFNNYFTINHITTEYIKKTLADFIGISEQLPPIYSAKKVNGKRAYEFARRGKDLDLLPRKIEIYNIVIEKIDIPFVTFKVLCSKGTYIRALARDIGEKLKSGAYLKSLCRNAIGHYKLEDAINMDDIKKFFDKCN